MTLHPKQLELTFIDRLGAQEDIPLDKRPPAQDGPALAHIPQVLDQFPHARVGDGNVLDVDGEEGKAGSL